jgi:hypothetical protein
VLSDFDTTAKQDQAATASFVANSEKKKRFGMKHMTQQEVQNLMTIYRHFYSK